MFALLKMVDKSTVTYEVTDETFAQMRSDFKAGGKAGMYDLANGGVARVNWAGLASLELCQEDPNRIIITSVGGDDDGPVFTRESMENW